MTVISLIVYFRYGVVLIVQSQVQPLMDVSSIEVV
jgi:hypothetical protein